MVKTPGLLEETRVGVLVRSTYTDRVVERIRADILAGVFEPGKRLRTSEVTSRYGISATPFREAVQRLAAEGLVELDPQFGVRVSPVSVSDLRDLYEARLLIEPMVIRKALAVASEEYRTAVRQAMRDLAAIPDMAGTTADAAGHREAWLAAHWKFHWAIVAGCHSKYLLQIMHLLYLHSQRYQSAALSVPGRQPVMEHAEICDAILRHDVEGAVEAIRRHLMTTLETLSVVRAERL